MVELDDFLSLVCSLIATAIRLLALVSFRLPSLAHQVCVLWTQNAPLVPWLSFFSLQGGLPRARGGDDFGR